MNRRAGEINEWVHAHPEEVYTRITTCKKLEELPKRAAILSRLDQLPNSVRAMRVPANDDRIDQGGYIYHYGNRSRQVYVTLSDEAFAGLAEPKRIRIEGRSGAFDSTINVFPLPRREREPIELYAGGRIDWD